MPIFKSITAPNGATVTFHKAMQASVDVVAARVALNVASWASEDDHNAGSGLVWMWPMDMAMAALADIDAALTMVDPFSGGTVVADQAQSLESVQIRQIAALEGAYAQAITGDVAFTTAAGDAHSYQCNPDTVGKLANSMLGCQGAQAVPDGFYWLATDNTRVPFTYADLLGLAAALFAQGHSAFTRLQDLKVAVRAAATPEAVRAIVWPAM